ncbi:MAG: FAD-binding protein [Anaerolineae bacterium]
MDQQATDVIVVGGGGAALRAALAAYETNPNLRICLVSKGTLGQSGVTATACSDRMAFHATLPETEPGGPDNWHYHAEDIYRIGGYVSDGGLAEVLAQNSAEAFRYLDRLGVPWVRRSDGSVAQFLTDGSRYARACYTGPYTANHIEAALIKRLAETEIIVLEHTMVADLALDASRQVCGVTLISETNGQSVRCVCRAVILAAGGAGQIFATNVYPPDCTGDGLALAYRAGAELVNLEFIQIGLCSVKTNLACSGSMMRALPRLINDLGQEFLADYMPHSSAAERLQTLFAKGASWPVSYNDPSHIIDIAVSREIANGRSVFIDYSTNPAGLAESMGCPGWQALVATMKGAETANWHTAANPLERLQAINMPAVLWLKERGVDLAAGDLLQIAPAAQHFQGGVKINRRAETSITGLYAAGEVAGGQHGANRPGGNALLDCQVFGRIAGENAARFCQNTRACSEEPVPSGEKQFTDSGIPAEEARTQVRTWMDQFCSVYRTENGLREALNRIQQLRRRGISDRDTRPAKGLEAVNILLVAELVLKSALERDESRGPHLRFTADNPRTPLPMRDPQWRHYIVQYTAAERPIIERRTPEQLTLPPERDSITHQFE